jgi:8-oxo-dGTP diphosphatase
MVKSIGTGIVHVAVGLLQDDQGRVLLAKRHEHVHQGGLWEFPGGKREAHESLSQALRRELLEELAIEVVAHRSLIRVHHQYADRSVLLDVQWVTDWRGQPQGREGQPLAWVEKALLHRYPMPPADLPIIAAVRLPDRYLILSPEDMTEAAFTQRLQRALQAGIRLVQFRSSREQSGHLLQAVALCRQYGAGLLINSGVSQHCDGQGLHLKSADLMGLDRRPTVSGWVAASCHDLQQLQQADRLGLDFAVLSAVQPTRSHPGAAALGWQGFADLVEQARLPVYALGGVGHLHPQQAWRFGGQGLAGIRGLW